MGFSTNVRIAGLEGGVPGRGRGGGTRKWRMASWRVRVEGSCSSGGMGSGNGFGGYGALKGMGTRRRGVGAGGGGGGDIRAVGGSGLVGAVAGDKLDASASSLALSDIAVGFKLCLSRVEWR